MYLAVAATVLSTGCSYDDSELKGRVDTLETDVAALKEKVAAIQSNLDLLTTAVRALEEADFVTAVNALTEGNGYEIVFKKSGTKYFYNGEDGNSPKISVKLFEEDNRYYWAVDGKFLLDDNGEKVPVTTEAATKLEGTFLYFSADGETWIPVGDITEKGLSPITDVIDDGKTVTFFLTDDSKIVLPKEQLFTLHIQSMETGSDIDGEMGVKAGDVVELMYLIDEPDDATMVKAFSEKGYDVALESMGSDIGLLTITVPDPLVDASILVVAINGKGVMSGKLLQFAKGEIKVENATNKTLAADGGNVKITVNTNIGYTVDIPVSWIKQAPQTKALRADQVTLIVSTNLTKSERTATIKVIDALENIVATFDITQAAGEDWQSADLKTLYPDGDATKSTEGYKSFTSTKGWVAANAMCYKVTDFNKGDALPDAAIKLNGVPATPGSITSPQLTGGCKKVRVDFGHHQDYSIFMPNGISLNVKILNSAGETLFTGDIKGIVDEYSQRTIMSQVLPVTGVTGNYTIVVTNNCPNAPGALKDIVAVMAIAYVPQE